MSFDPLDEMTKSLPADWQLRRLKEVAEVIPSNVDKNTVEGQQPVRLCNYVDVYKNETVTSSIEFMKATATASQVERLGLSEGDVVVTKDSESPWDIAVPTLVGEQIDGLVCGYHLAKIRPTEGVCHGPFLAWALRSNLVNLQFALNAKGITRYGLSASSLADGRIPLPPIEKQEAIARFIDLETKKIDELIREKRREIELLLELRTATITEAVHGLIPTDELNVQAD